MLNVEDPQPHRKARFLQFSFPAARNGLGKLWRRNRLAAINLRHPSRFGLTLPTSSSHTGCRKGIAAAPTAWQEGTQALAFSSAKMPRTYVLSRRPRLAGLGLDPACMEPACRPHSTLPLRSRLGASTGQPAANMPSGRTRSSTCLRVAISCTTPYSGCSERACRKLR